MKKIVCLVGPTAVGKSALAEVIHSQLPSTLLSADSRQVYRGMDIVTGKDHSRSTIIRGIDLVAPDVSCSVALWYDKVKDTLSTKDLLLAVGGTGLYFRALVGEISTLHIPPNQVLRRKLSALSVKELQSRLSDPRLALMNDSDRHNPRRLLRAIELASSQVQNHNPIKPEYEVLNIGLRYFDNDQYLERIKARVLARLEGGAIEETKKLLSTYSPALASMSALGYKHIICYLRGDLSETQLVEHWVRDELAYAKRQLTWFRRVKPLTWYDPTNQATKDLVVKEVKAWYYRKGHERNSR